MHVGRLSGGRGLRGAASMSFVGGLQPRCFSIRRGDLNERHRG
ncbi:hypothetical protein LG3211_4470 [Lysobacter gummosus]|nr:hypothetical protein LG3211_4470 [Lysobacter gummosus]